MKEKKYKSLSITVSPENAKKLDDGKYNRNKLIISLLKEYLEKLKK